MERRSKRRRRPSWQPPPLRISHVLGWADAHHRRTGRWPNVYSSKVPDGWGETWSGISQALDHGARGLPGGSSLAKLLAEKRGVRNKRALPRLSSQQILSWADAHRLRTGEWPIADSGPVIGAAGEIWKNIDAALRQGLRGLPVGQSLASLLAEHRGYRHNFNAPRLRVERILKWSEAHHQRTGEWPHSNSGPVLGARGEDWLNINRALRLGLRGLPGGSSLADVLRVFRGVPRRGEHHERLGNVRLRIRGVPALQHTSAGLVSTERPKRPPLTESQILAWVDAHHRRTGTWPNHLSGPVTDAPNETWGGIHSALYVGHRGFPGGSSLAQLLALQRGVRNPRNLPCLTITRVLTWADDFHRKTGKWPHAQAGTIPGTQGETWSYVDQALDRGHRGLSGGSSLARLLQERRGHRNSKNLPFLTVGRILRWADEHHRRAGQWPNQKSGPVIGAPGEKWRNIKNSLQRGQRGLPAGLTIHRLLVEHRRV